MWGLIVVHYKQVFQFNCVCYNKVPLYTHVDIIDIIVKNHAHV